MKKIFKKVAYSFLLAVCLAGSVASTSVAATKKYVTVKLADGKKSKNISTSYFTGREGWIKESNLFVNGKGFDRVESIGSYVYVDQYSSSYKLKKEIKIKNELPIFGGAFCGSKYIFLVFGQSNSAESTSQEVIRVVKYDKNWQKLGVASIKGANTTIPFKAGSLDMTEAQGKLFIHTCHQMFKSSDGLNHQANCAFTVNISDMSVVDSQYIVSYEKTGYVSHSFSQKIATDGTYIYRADLGDAYPRSVTLNRVNVNGKLATPDYMLKFNTIAGTIGNNTTGYSVDDIVLGSNNVLVLGIGAKSNKYSNVYLQVAAKDGSSKKTVWLTNTKNGTKYSYPKIVKLSKNSFLVMYEKYTKKDGVYTSSGATMLKVDETGKKTGSTYKTFLHLDSCDPIYNNGKVVWYCKNGSKPMFVEINPSSLKKVTKEPVAPINYIYPGN